jgi:hypothetical protein
MSYKRKAADKRRLKKLHEATKQGYGAGAYYDYRKGRIVRYSDSRKELTRATCGAVQIRKYGGLRLLFREVATDESMIIGGSFVMLVQAKGGADEGFDHIYLTGDTMRILVI